MSMSMSASAPHQRQRRVAVVTGAGGYVGRAVVHALLDPNCNNGDDDKDGSTCNNEGGGCTQEDEVICLVRPPRVRDEARYWEEAARRACDGSKEPPAVTVLPYDMLDGGQTLDDALRHACGPAANGSDAADTSCCVYHVASVFGPTDNHTRTALDNVRGTEDAVRCAARYNNQQLSSDANVNVRMVLTSSMAAVRATDQPPLNGEHYTYQDWNTQSELGKNWGQSYQWSKAESERRAWELAEELDLEMVSLCPSFVFGPPAATASAAAASSKSSTSSSSSESYSVALVRQWVRGESDVQSRLCVDVRDAALAHVRAGRRRASDAAAATKAKGRQRRYILSSEARLPSVEVGNVLRRMARDRGLDDMRIACDTHFDGGAIPIGTKEVDAADRLANELGIVCRPNEETFRDMAKFLFDEDGEEAS